MYKMTVTFKLFRVGYGIKSPNKRFDDISSNRKAVKELCEICNSLELEECHLTDAVEDFLWEQDPMGSFRKKKNERKNHTSEKSTVLR